MSQIPLRSVRLNARPATTLESFVGTAGEIFYDSTNQTLRVYPGNIAAGKILADRDWVNTAIGDIGTSSLVNGTRTVSLSTAGSLTIPGDIRSESNINIDINLSDSTLRRWQFGEDGNLAVPGDINLSGGTISQYSQNGLTGLKLVANADQGQNVTIMGTGNNTFPILNYVGTTLSGITIGTPEGDWNFMNGNLTIPGDIKSNGNINIDINLADSTLRRWQFGEDGELTFPEGYLKIVPNGANPYISNRIDNGLGLVSGSAIQIRQSVADAYGISINSSTTYTSLGDGLLLASGSNIDVNGSKIILGQYVVNNLDADNGLTGQNKIEINNGEILIGLDVSNLTNGTTTSAFSGWTFNGQADTLTFPDSTVQTTAWTGIANALRSETGIYIDVNLSDSTLRRWQFGEDGDLTLPTGGDIKDSTGTSVLGGGTSIPAVVTTGALGVSGQAHVKVQFTVTSATTVTAVGVTVIGISTPASGRITLSGSPGTGSFDIIAATGVNAQTFILMPFATNASGTGYGAPIAGTGTDPCLVRGTLITMADMSRVAVENITYHDDILVWDFDLGEFASAKPLWIKKTQTTVVSCLLTFSDHSILQIVGESPKAHRIFNKEAGKFTYGSMPETPIGTTTFNDNGEEITLISKQWIVGEVEFYNVITDYHMNLFANSILTSMRYNNLYPITDMKFVKDGRTLRTADDYPNVEERLYKGFRLAEQTQSVEEIETHIQWLLSLEVERETECV